MKEVDGEVAENLGLLGPLARCQLLPTFLGEASLSFIDYRKKGYPYSNLSTEGPSLLAPSDCQLL